MNEEEREIVAKYLLEVGKERIKRAGCRSVDWYGQLFWELLTDLGDEKRAEELLEFYRGWGR